MERRRTPPKPQSRSPPPPQNHRPPSPGRASLRKPTSPRAQSTPARIKGSPSRSSLVYKIFARNIANAIFDNICLLIFCPQHKKVLLTRGTKRFLPCAPMTDCNSSHSTEGNIPATWEETAFEAALNLALCGQEDDDTVEEEEIERRIAKYRKYPPFSAFNLVHLMRIQLPHSERFITRLVFLVKIHNLRIDCNCRSNSSETSCVRWYPIEDAIEGNLENVWGPEVAFFSRLLISERSGATMGDDAIQEYSLADAYMYKIPPEDPETEDQTSARELLAHVSPFDVERAYADFLEHVFPSYYLSRASFLLYLARHNIVNLEESKPSLHGSRLFAAFRRRGGGQQYLCFTELLLGLAAVERRSKNCPARLALVFRYYDVNRDGMLSVAEFRPLLEHLMLKSKSMEKKKSCPNSKSSNENTNTASSSTLSSEVEENVLTDAEVAKEMRRIGGSFLQLHGGRQEMVVTKEVFLKAVFGPKKLLKGTNQLVRLTMNPFLQITRSIAARTLVKSSSKLNASEVLVKRKYEGKCTSCTAKAKKAPFEIAHNIVRLNRQGEVTGWEPVSQPVSTSPSTSEQITFPAEGLTGARWLHNLHAKIRAHNEGQKGTREAPIGLYMGKPEASFLGFFEAVKRIARELGAILEAEERVPKVSVPVFIIGDIHGNLEDLLSIERCIFRSTPFLTANYLFLGDYVDRGKWGFECFLWLAVAKLLNRDKITLLRGNHEHRPTQDRYKFKEELLYKYGQNYGLKFWDLVNYVCDRLPCCAVVEGSIFTAHGGIPYSLHELDAINARTPKVIENPDRSTAPWVWQMMWNDPMDWNQFLEAAQLQKIVPSVKKYTYMYIFNKKRGTAYVFNEYAVAAFLRLNRLQYVIRAHEVPDELGVRFNFGRLCTTIFSCSHYGGKNNECSVILVNGEGRIRVLRIDTRTNKPAM